MILRPNNSVFCCVPYMLYFWNRFASLYNLSFFWIGFPHLITRWRIQFTSPPRRTFERCVLLFFYLIILFAFLFNFLSDDIHRSHSFYSIILFLTFWITLKPLHKKQIICLCESTPSQLDPICLDRVQLLPAKRGYPNPIQHDIHPLPRTTRFPLKSTKNPFRIRDHFFCG